MRIVIKYDKGLLDGLKIDQKFARKIENALVKTSLLRLYSNWSDLANSQLNSSRNQYIKSLSILGGQENRNTGSVRLSGVLPNMVENGASAFDMKCIVDGQTSIYTSKGSKKIRDIKIGDLVLTHKGKMQRVSNIFKEKNEDQFIYRIITKLKGGDTKLTVTGNHPILTDKGWIRADELNPCVHKIFVTAVYCKNCGNKIACEQSRQELDNNYCNKSCACSENNKTLRTKGRKDFKIGTIERISKAAKRTNQRLIKEGIHVTQPGGAFHKFVNDKERYDSVFTPEKRRSMLINLNSSLGRKARKGSTIPEELLWNRINDINGIERQYIFKRDSFVKINGSKDKYRNRYFYFDFAIPEHKIAIEVNGERWHTKEQDDERRKEVESKGWRYISFWSKEIYKDLDDCVNEIKRVLNNHEGKYLIARNNFTIEKIDISKLKKFNHLFRWKFNLTVENDSSYIASSIVTHNSGFAASSKVKFNKKGEWYLTIPLSPTQRNISTLINTQLSSKINDLILSARAGGDSSANIPSENKGSSTIPKSSSSVIIQDINQVFNYYKGRSKSNSETAIPTRVANPIFRRVGENSKPSSWQHPGIIAHKLGLKALEKLKQEQDMIVENVVGGILKEKGLI